MKKYSVRESVWQKGKFKVVEKDWLLGWVDASLPVFETFDDAYQAALALKNLL